MMIAMPPSMSRSAIIPPRSAVIVDAMKNRMSPRQQCREIGRRPNSQYVPRRRMCQARWPSTSHSDDTAAWSRAAPEASVPLRLLYLAMVAMVTFTAATIIDFDAGRKSFCGFWWSPALECDINCFVIIIACRISREYDACVIEMSRRRYDIDAFVRSPRHDH